MKKWLWGVVLLLLMAIVGYFVYYVFWMSEMIPDKVISEIRGTVESWDEEKGIVKFVSSTGKKYQWTIVPGKPTVVVPKTKPGELRAEDLVISRQSYFWKIMFCPGDFIEFKLKEPVKSRKLVWEKAEWEMIRNLGERACAWEGGKIGL